MLVQFTDKRDPIARMEQERLLKRHLARLGEIDKSESGHEKIA